GQRYLFDSVGFCNRSSRNQLSDCRSAKFQPPGARLLQQSPTDSTGAQVSLLSSPRRLQRGESWPLLRFSSLRCSTIFKGMVFSKERLRFCRRRAAQNLALSNPAQSSQSPESTEARRWLCSDAGLPGQLLRAVCFQRRDVPKGAMHASSHEGFASW